MEKEFLIEVKLVFDNIITAENEEKAKEILKEQFLQDYNLQIEDSEIKFKE